MNKEARSDSQLINVLGRTIDKEALNNGYDLIKNSTDEVLKGFYTEFFQQNPEYVALFENENENENETNCISQLEATLKLLFENIEDEATLSLVFRDLGERHHAFGADKNYYDAAAELLLATCKKHAGRKWTKKISISWQSLLSAVSETMLNAGQEAESIEVDEIIQDPEVNIEADVLVLQSIQDISKSEILKQEMLSMIKESKCIQIDASDVGRIDGSAMQLLCCLFEYSKSSDIQLSWKSPSDAMLVSAEYLGIKELLELNEQ